MSSELLMTIEEAFLFEAINFVFIVEIFILNCSSKFLRLGKGEKSIRWIVIVSEYRYRTCYTLHMFRI
jgi:hypothetical protein